MRRLSDEEVHAVVETAGALDELRGILDRSRSSVWDVPDLTRGAVVSWADNAPVDWPAQRRPEVLDDARPWHRDATYQRFRSLDDADDIKALLAWYVRHLIPAAAITEGIAWG